MNHKHIFVPAIDVGEFLPFSVKQSHKLYDQIKEQERAKKELEKFISLLEKNYGENIFYLGMDIIGEKSYERFIFETHGFFEVMTETPIVLNAHFVNKEKAKKFAKALKKTLKKLLPKTQIIKMFIDSIKVETDQELTVKKWHIMKKIKNETD